MTDKKSSDAKPTRSSKDINVYLEWMEPRLREIYRVLKPTGSFYLHCFYPDTKILMSDLTEKKICDIKEGDMVKINTETGKYVERTS